MARIYPFSPLRYNPLKVGNLAEVLTQPYDKITPAMQQRYYAQPFNLVRIILGKQQPDDNDHENVYTRAVETFHQWVKEGILVQDDRPSFYAYYQQYQLPDGIKKVRKGFIGLGQLEDYGAGVVFPHERTLAGPKADRLKLLRATQAHFEQLLMLYTDPKREIDALLDQRAVGEPDIRVRDEYGVEHAVWRIVDGWTIDQLQRIMAERPLIIADGHHRYETAVAYRNERRAQAGVVDLSRPYERVVMTFFNTESEGLTILPTHRLIKSTRPFAWQSFMSFAEQHFDIEAYSFGDPEQKAAAALALRRDMEQLGRERPTVGLYWAHANALYRLTFRATPESLALMSGLSPRQHTLDVAVLHTILIEHGLRLSADVVAKEEPIAYIREFEGGIQMVDDGRGAACFFLNPTRIEQVYAMAVNGEVLPQKSTDFYPKLLSGLTIYRLD
jgi:uncharacterized protein (DUF1015 family)